MHAFIHSITPALELASSATARWTTLLTSIRNSSGDARRRLSPTFSPLSSWSPWSCSRFFIVVRLSLNVERPNPGQSIAEMLMEFTSSQGDAIIGHGYEPHLPFVDDVVLVFILLCNCMVACSHRPRNSDRPSLRSARLGHVDFSLLQLPRSPRPGTGRLLQAFRRPGLVDSPVDVASGDHLPPRPQHVAPRFVFTRTCWPADLLTLVFFSIFPLVLPIVFLGLHFGVAMIQAYVWMLLAFIYLAEATAHEELPD